ncbi:unnamed protein product [Dovyalis caffra]|uniref:RING-type E3 ubiquitin transferase n=1 Tax=Dovyalis caffra TaxID=77055 RepID=A0AAV1RDF9_9ROSI|nr:unnamed protein product [Dovyalis caffra]
MSSNELQEENYDQIDNKESVLQADDFLLHLIFVELDYPLERSKITKHEFLMSRRLTSDQPSTTALVSQMLSRISILTTIEDQRDGLAHDISKQACSWPTDEDHMFVHSVIFDIVSWLGCVTITAEREKTPTEAIFITIDTVIQDDELLSSTDGCGFAWKKSENIEQPMDCAICLEEILIPKIGGAACLPCSHVYHHYCIVRWFLESNLCPLCRVRVFAGMNT